MISLMELLEKEKLAVHEADDAYSDIAFWNESIVDDAPIFGGAYYERCKERIKKAEKEFDKATQEVREIRKQIKEHIAMIMAID